MGPAVGSQPELLAPSLPTISQQTSRHMAEKPREALSAVPLPTNAVSASLVSPAVGQSIGPPAALPVQPVTDSRYTRGHPRGDSDVKGSTVSRVVHTR